MRATSMEPIYFSAYRSLKLTRYAEGVLIDEFHSGCLPLIFIQGARHELSSPKSGMMTLISLRIVVAFVASLISSLGFSKLTSGAVNAQFLRHFRLNVTDNGTATQLGAHYVGSVW